MTDHHGRPRMVTHRARPWTITREARSRAIRHPDVRCAVSDAARAPPRRLRPSNCPPRRDRRPLERTLSSRAHLLPLVAPSPSWPDSSPWAHPLPLSPPISLWPHPRSHSPMATITSLWLHPFPSGYAPYHTPPGHSVALALHAGASLVRGRAHTSPPKTPSRRQPRPRPSRRRPLVPTSVPPALSARLHRPHRTLSPRASRAPRARSQYAPPVPR